MALAEWERTADLTTRAAFQFMKILASNNLLDEAQERLHAKGLDQIRVRVPHMRELQEMVKEHFPKKGGNPGAENSV